MNKEFNKWKIRTFENLLYYSRKVVMSISLILLMTNVVFAQKKVSGKITDQADGTALPGVTIKVKGTNTGTQSDINGDYKITVTPNSDVLVFNFVGKSEQEITVGNRSVIDVSLASDNKVLQEVVVVGYGTQRKQDLTGSITSISSTDFIKGNVVSPEQLISGKLAGVQITSNGGAPGSGSRIRIRGGSSLSANNDPLIVIDGIPLDNSNVSGSANALSFINPNDIETFNILKDASAAAIYGSRAANGVIIITTKKGSKKDKMNVNFSSLFSSASPINYVSVLSADEFKTAVETFGTATQKELLGKSNTNWQEQIYRTALSHDNNVSVTGNLKKMPYRVSVGFLNQNGILKTSNMERTSGSIGLTPSFMNDHLKVDINFKAASSKSNFADEGAIGTAIGFDPTQAVNAENKFGGYFQWLTKQGDLAALAPVNPLALLNLQSNVGTLKRMIGNVQADYKFHFLPNLRAVWNIGFDQSNTKGDQISSNLVSANAFTNNGSTGFYRQNRNNFTNQFYLNYVKDFKNQTFNIMAGAENQGFVREDESGTVFGKSEIAPVNSYFKTDYALQSFFGRLNYALNEKYLATVTVRRDGSSRFAKENRWGTFPSVALAWKLNKEFKNASNLSDLKLRFGWGITGQQDLSTGDYPYLNAYTKGQGLKYQFGDKYYDLLRPNAYDPNIKWEETASTNLGLDFGLKKARISGSVDVYQKKTTDLINEIDVAAGSNFSNKVTTNVGTLENKGVEAILNFSPIVKQNFNWDISGNFTYNERKITALTKVDNPTYVGVLVGGINGGIGNYAQVHSTGYAPNTFFVYKQVYDVAGKPIDGLFEDLNADGVITELDRYRYQSAVPKFFLGFSSQMTYKAASVGFVMRSNIGNYAFNNIYSNRGTYANVIESGNYNTNPSANVLETGFKSKTDQTILSDYYVQNASFLRMDNLNFGYSLDNLLKMKKMKAQLSFIVQNVFVVTKYTGLDPEIADGLDTQLYPRPRTYSFGLNLNF